LTNYILADSIAGLHRKLPIDLEKLPIRAPTKRHILLLQEKLATEEAFGVAKIAALTGLKDRAARNLLALMREHNLVSDVKGHGKSKVRFAQRSERCI